MLESLRPFRRLIRSRRAAAIAPAAVSLLLLTAAASAHPNHGLEKVATFRYDEADAKTEATMLENKLFYDPDVLTTETGGRLLTWLEYTPEKGDHIYLGLRGEGANATRRITDRAGRYAHPTLTRDAGGKHRLSYEAYDADAKRWDVMLRPGEGDQGNGSARRITEGPGNAINHDVAAGPDGGLWVVWQADRKGQFEIMARRISPDNELGETQVVSDSPRGDWVPKVAVGADGTVTIAWDSFDGENYNVLARRFADGQWQSIQALATGDAFQGRPDVAAGKNGRTWIAWEQGSTAWGEPYKGNGKNRRNINDANGPMHLHRRLRLAVFTDDGTVHPLANPLPMPAIEKAKNRDNKRKGVNLLGTYYERPELATDESGRLWVAYRHFYLPQVGRDESLHHHVERGWRLYARCLEEDGWSKLYAITPHQRDGMQRLSLAPTQNGLTLAYTTGRTDRNTDPEPHGVALASIKHRPGNAPEPKLAEAANPGVPEIKPIPPEPESVTVGGKQYKPYFGDLHRHTDLSLCFPFFDGSIQDAYRYAIDSARLDFLGITDHTRDIAKGDELSLLWWRSTKEVTRHHLQDTFYPFFSYERSGGNADHNVISLRDDMLAPHQPPVTEFWKQIQHGDTITIPHTPFRNKQLWAHQNDEKRPLMEVYQGFRNAIGLEGKHEAHDALDRGHHVGFIASSDHMSTLSSYAVVWSAAGGREPIFRALQARRAYGATDKIRLIFRAGEQWMGERITAESQAGPTFHVTVKGEAPIKSLAIYRDGERAAALKEAAGKKTFNGTWQPTTALTGKDEHYFYVHVQMQNGEQAWASPIWVTPAK